MPRQLTPREQYFASLITRSMGGYEQDEIQQEEYQEVEQDEYQDEYQDTEQDEEFFLTPQEMNAMIQSGAFQEMTLEDFFINLSI